MNFKLLLIGIFAICASYLIFSTTMVSATNVRIYYNGVQQSSVQYNPQTFVSRDVSVESGNVKIAVTNVTGASIQKIYVYKCKGLTPTDCASTASPEIAESSFSGTYSWSDVAGTTVGYPQTANFMILAKVSVSGKVFWTGFWHWVERTDASTYSPYESQLGEMQVHAKDLDDVSTIGNFINSNRMIPFNPQWVTKIIFPVASALQMIKSTLGGIESQQFTPSEISGNQLTSLDQDYGFAFSDMGGTILSPVMLNMNPSYTCGNGNCESGLGETQANCCNDCACQTAYYCDSAGSCKQSSGISLSLYGTPQTTVSNCNQPHVLNVTVKVNNPPTGMSVSTARFKLGSAAFQGTSCAASSGYIYNCPVTVPAVPGCQAGTYRLGPNYLNLTISYPDGKGTGTKTMAVSFPDVTIGSYSCGNGVCESSLGESQTVCCYDCGCASGYCDVQNSSVNSCRTEPSNGNLIAAGLAPSQFYTHIPGDSVRFLGQIIGSPATVSVTDDSCSIKCTRSDSQACSASCDVSCAKVGSSDATVYNSSCSISFTISGYDPLKSYSLYPTLNFSIIYTNGSRGAVNKVLSNSLTTISIGSHWCGDKKCDPDESSATCCYDCACASGQYCDTQNLAYKSQGDSCKANPQVQIDPLSPMTFSNTYVEHAINVTGSMTAKPGGIELSPACVFVSALSGVPCYVSCQEMNGSGTVYNFLCQLTVPSIDYNTSSYFNPSTKVVLLNPNSFNLSFSYNNGPSKKVDAFSSAVPQIAINVVAMCGNDVCESNVGESPLTCCLDCDCGLQYGKGYFCYTGKKANGECLSVSSINMRIKEVQPEPMECIISSLGKQCTFTSAAKMYPVVMNPPSDMQIVEAYYRVNTNGTYTNYTSVNCYPTGEGEGNYSCALALEKSNLTTPGNETRTIELKMTLAYTSDGAPTVKNVSDSFTFTVNRKYSDAVSSCFEQTKSVDKRIKKLKSDKTLYIILAIIFFILMIIFIILYIICWADCGTAAAACIEACWLTYENWIYVSAAIGGCALTFVISKLESIDQNIRELQQRRMQICVAEGFGQLAGAVDSAGNWVYTVGKIAGTIGCMLGTSGIVG